MKRIERQLAAILTSAAIFGTAVQFPASANPGMAQKGGESPASTGALPAGHPPVPGAEGSAKGLPAGHPPVPGTAGGQQGLPAGHPPVPGSGGMQALPAGHPPVPGKAAASQPSVIGSLRVQAVQGTAGGPAIGSEAVTVEFYRNGMVVQKVDAKLDDKGQAAIADVQVGMGVQALVKVNHAGVAYEAVAEPMTAEKPNGEVKVSVHETTEQAPAWEIGMRHVMLEPSPEGLRVMEMISVHNPSDRAWVGAAGSDGKRTTFAWPLPVGAKDVQIGGGFDDCCTVVENGKLVNSMALMPGQTKYQIAYNVPINGGKAEVLVASPAAVKHLMVFAADDGTTVTAEGLASGSADMGGQKTRYYKASNVAAGKQYTVTVSGIRQADTAGGPPAAGAAPRAAAGGAAAQTAKVVAGAGGLLVVLFGGAVMFAKGSAGAAKKA